ncbi:LuxR C-terminal-related transcriptional regulator [Streptomyces sp. NPDC005336]|uniref:helix-turn-helix transcriptional regulator n=1 Tax=unclassified Streptomyces TaxID=2593676 RepID=UPI0033A11021
MDSFPGATEDTPSLDANQVRIYEHIVRSGRISSADLHRGLDIPASRIDSALRSLLSVHLIRRASTAGAEWTASSPSVAAAALITPLEEELRERRKYIDVLKGALEGLIPIYFSAQTGSDLLSVELVDDAGAVRSLLAASARQCQSDVVIAHFGGDCPAEVLTECDPAMMQRGVRIRSLHHHTARSHQGTRAFAERATGLGAEVRTTEEVYGWLIAFDRRIAFLPGGHPGTTVVVRQPAVVDFICDTFERAWRFARPFREARASVTSASRATSTTSKEMERAIVQLLAAGEKDQVIARRLGIAVRTCRRYIAMLMQRLGAESRFQAGYLLGLAEQIAARKEEQAESYDQAR